MQPVRFSVFMPVFNPDASQMRHALYTVCTQLPATHHQIAVIDDASSSDVPQRIAAEFPGVRFIRQDEELGGVRTHNRAFSLADGDLVQILHPDDWMLQGAYLAILDTYRRNPGRAIYAGLHMECDCHGLAMHAAPPTWLRDHAGAGRSFQPLHEGNPVAVPATFYARGFLQSGGGWREELIHTADWELAVRATTLGGGAAVHWPIACYRNGHAGSNHTSRIVRTADNLRDYLRCADAVGEYAPVDRAKFREFVEGKARQQASWLRTAGDAEAAVANEDFREKELPLWK